MCVIDSIMAKIPDACDCPANEGGTMYEENRILSKIEQRVDKLPYRSVKIEVELKDKTLTLHKECRQQIGFATEVKPPQKK